MSISSRMACANLLDAASSTFSSRCVFRLMLALDRQPGSSHSVCNQTETRVWGSTNRPIAVSSAVHAQLPEIWLQGSGNVPTRSWFIDRLKSLSYPICAKTPFHYKGLSLAAPPSTDNVRIFDICILTTGHPGSGLVYRWWYRSHTVVLCTRIPFGRHQPISLCRLIC